MHEKAQNFTLDMPVHVLMRGASLRPCFYLHEDYRYFLQGLQIYAAVFSCAVHAYVVMSKHVHLLLTAEEVSGVASLVEQMMEFHTSYINRSYLKKGVLWQRKYHAQEIHTAGEFIACQRYIELDPVRANIVSSPEKYYWSSYPANARGIDSPLLTPHPYYLRLGKSVEQRLAAYRKLFRLNIDIKKGPYFFDGPDRSDDPM